MEKTERVTKFPTYCNCNRTHIELKFANVFLPAKL